MAHRMTRRSVLAGAGAALLAGERAAAQTAPGLVTLRVASTANDDATTLVYAQNAGLFKSVGIDVTFQKANSGSAVAAAIAGGAIDIGKSSIIPVVNGHARGIPFTIVAPCSLYHNHDLDSGLVVANDGPHTARELTGKVISVAGLQDTTWLSARAWIDKNGGDSTAVRFIEVPGSSVLSALEEGRITAGTMSEPYVTQNVKSGKARLLAVTLEAIAPRWLIAVYMSTTDFVAKNRDLVVRFQKAMAQSATYCNTHQAETVPMMAQFTGLDPAILSQVTRAYDPPNLDPRDIQPIINAAAKYKLIEKPFDARELIALR
jgi:NitT/TauT family transport system substrate-binding protein